MRTACCWGVRGLNRVGKQEACPLLPPSGGFGASYLQNLSGAGWYQPQHHGAGQKSAAEG